MFWLIWLPLCIVAFLIIAPILNKKLGVWIKNGGLGGWSFIVVFVAFIGLVINFGTPPQTANTVYPDLQNPIYLVQIPGNQDNKYLISTEDLINGEEHILYILDRETGIPKQVTFSHSQLRIIYDNPSRPFLAKIIYSCETSPFWLLICSNPSPYLYELHLSDNSILK